MAHADPVADLNRPRVGLLDPERVAAERAVVERIRAKTNHRQLARQLTVEKKRRARVHHGAARKKTWWARRRRAVYERDGHRCQGCRVIFPADLLTLDHIVPKSRGGGNSLGNLQTMCGPCNVAKGDRMPEAA